MWVQGPDNNDVLLTFAMVVGKLNKCMAFVFPHPPNHHLHQGKAHYCERISKQGGKRQWCPKALAVGFANSSHDSRCNPRMTFASVPFVCTCLQKSSELHIFQPLHTNTIPSRIQPSSTSNSSNFPTSIKQPTITQFIMSDLE
jgi:hypothetical protein